MNRRDGYALFVLHEALWQFSDTNVLFSPVIVETTTVRITIED